MRFTVFSAMLLGPRAKQEDCIFDGTDLFQSDALHQKKIIDADFLLLCICDGMGGHDHGETASRFVCEQILAKFNATGFSAENITERLKEIQETARQQLPENCGTTAAGLMIKDGRVIAFNAGDSRVYKITPAGVEYISHDHSLVQGLVDKSFILKDSAHFHPLKNIINFGIGPLFSDVWNDFAVHIFEESLSSEVFYLICSDGVSDLIDEQEISDLLMPSPVENGNQLSQALQRKGLKDNTSFIILQIHGSSETGNSEWKK